MKMKKGLSPTLWRTCRVLANQQRLDILRALVGLGELRVCDVAREVGLTEAIASQYLRALNARGLLTARRESRWVYYRMEANPSVNGATRLLGAVMVTVGNPAMTDSSIMYLMTAFTHPRRIELVRRLSAGSCAFGELVSDCEGSPAALTRHLVKLRKRGFVALQDAAYTLIEQRVPLARVLLQLAVE